MWHFSARAVNYYHEMNWSYEAEEIRFSRADFRSVVKVDTHIHAASARARGGRGLRGSLPLGLCFAFVIHLEDS
jgi:hypothetical protein